MSTHAASSPTVSPGDAPGAPAIEVVAMLGDSIVGVSYCMEPRGGRIRRATWGIAALGLACLLAAAVAFVVSVRTAAHNQRGLAQWTRGQHRPAFAYRPTMLGVGYDGIALGGLVIGVGALATALARARRERRSPYFRIGTAPGVTQPVEEAPTSDFPLVAPAGDAFVFHVAPGMRGSMELDERRLSFDELVASGHARASSAPPGALGIAIPRGGRIRTQVGRTSFVVTGVDAPARHAASPWSGLERRTAAYLAGSLAVHLSAVLLLSLIPVDDGAVALDLATPEETLARASGAAREDLTPEPPDREPGLGDAGGTEARSMALAEGAAGTTRSSRPDGHLRIADRGIEPQTARQQAIEEARTAGVLGSAALVTGQAFASLTSTEDLSSGFDAADVYGPMFGAEGEGHGYFGYGRSGFGPGGGCDRGDCGIIGTPDGYGKIGLSGKKGDGWGLPGRGGPGAGRHAPRVPEPRFGTATGSGDIDPAIIRRYVKRQTDKIAYCYERQLLAHPGIAGTVQVSFFISPNGTVASSTGAGFDAEVASCVAEVVHAIEFPRPPSGGGVQVNYPFTFRAADR